MRRLKLLALLALTICAATAGALLCTTGSALASTPIAVDVPNNGATPDVVFDPVTQDTFIAWTDPQSTTNGGIDLCVLLKNTSSCEGGGPVLLTVNSTENPAITGDNTISLGGITVLPNGDVVVIGTPVSNSSVAWESPGDGSAFLTSGQGLENGGSFISPVSLFYTGGNVVALSNTDVGLLDDYGDYFSDSPFAGPEFPATLKNSNTNPPPAGQTSSLYPRKALDTVGPEVAAEPVPAPAPAGSDIVVAVGDNYAGPNTQLSDCVNGDDVGTGYGVDAGLVGESSASGFLNAQNSAGDSIPAYSGLACNAENPVAASPEGGTQGIGALENEGDGLDGGTEYTLDYRPFTLNPTATGGSFGAAALVSKLTGAAGDIDVVDDSTDGVYAFWDAGGSYYVNYSSDGGAVWGAPVEIPGSGSESDGSISAIGGGAFLYGYTDNTGSGKQTFLQSLSYQTLEQQPTTVSTVQASGATKGSRITIPAGTIGESDTATIAGTNAALATGTVDFALYKTSACTGTPVFAGAAAASGGTASIADDSSTGLAPGTYYWRVAYSGNTFNGASASTCGSEVLTVGTAATVPASATATSTSVTLTVTCATTPCTITITITIPAAGTAFDRAGVKKPKLITLATGRFTLSKKGKHVLKLKWNSKGRNLIKREAKLRTTLALSAKTKHGTFKSTHALKITKRK